VTLTERDRRALVYLAAAVTLALAYQFWPQGVAAPATASPETVEMAEQRLARLRDIAAAAPAKQEVLKKVAAELATREAGLLRADTAQQAQAQVITMLREVLSGEGIELRSTELGPVQAVGDRYGLAPVSLQFECRVEQFVNVLAAVAGREELITTRDFQVTAANPRDKTIRVRLTVAGVVPKSLVPEKGKQGVAGF
jgi:Tfp pilus assembly protein PilO